MPPRMPAAVIVGDAGGVSDMAADLLQQQRERRERREHEGIAAVGEQRHGANRNHEQDPQAAGDAAAREHQQADRDRVDQHVNEGRCTQIGQQPSAADDNGDARGEIDDAGPEEQLRPCGAEQGRPTPPKHGQRVDRMAESAADTDSPGR